MAYFYSQHIPTSDMLLHGQVFAVSVSCNCLTAPSHVVGRDFLCIPGAQRAFGLFPAGQCSAACAADTVFLASSSYEPWGCCCFLAERCCSEHGRADRPVRFCFSFFGAEAQRWVAGSHDSDIAASCHILTNSTVPHISPTLVIFLFFPFFWIGAPHGREVAPRRGLGWRGVLTVSSAHYWTEEEDTS